MCPRIKAANDWYYDTESKSYEHVCRSGKLIVIPEKQLAADGGTDSCKYCGAIVTLPIPEREVTSE